MGSVVVSQTVTDAANFLKSKMLETSSHRPVEHNSYHTPPPSSQSSSSRTRSLSRPNPTSRPPSSASSQHAATQSTPTRPIPPRESAPPPTTTDTTGPGSEPSEPKLEPSSQAPSSLTDSVPDLMSDKSSAQSSPATSFGDRASLHEEPRIIKIQSLQHIQSFLDDEHNPLGFGRPASQLSDTKTQQPQFEISAMPIQDVIEMVAGLLTKITTTNDRQHEHLHQTIPEGEGGSKLPQQTSSVLAFHGKNVPNITILSYLSRIHRYCPTTYEVFISLLVYFDRMAEVVNRGPMQSLKDAAQEAVEQDRKSVDAAEDEDIEETSTDDTESQSDAMSTGTMVPDSSLAHFFVVDSFNIHRLVIAAVTCASKYFSDVFYTNSRYAKVGGLPLNELNHLEVQFLLLNDFRLAVSVEELEAYATMLVQFYAREVLAQREASPKGGEDVEAMEGVESTQGSSA